MPIASRFRQSLVIQRYAAGSPDARGDVAATFTPQAPIRGWIQPSPKPPTELRALEPAGASTDRAIAFLPFGTTIGPADRIALGDELYEVVGPAADAGGRGKHLEVDLLRVLP